MFSTEAKKARELVAELETLGFKPPKPVAQAVTRLDLIESRKPTRPTPADLESVYYGDDFTDEAAVDTATRMAVWKESDRAWTSARDRAGRDILHRVAEAVPDIVETFRPAADEAIDTLNWYVAEGRPDIAALVLAGRDQDAKRAASITETWVGLQRRQAARAAALGRPNFKWYLWANPYRVETLRVDPNLPWLDRILLQIEGGGELVWSTYEHAESIQEQLNGLRLADQEAAANKRSLARRAAV